jgi:REP element-mobilizing transposase RayT
MKQPPSLTLRAIVEELDMREHEPPMPEPLAYFLTWTTYGTWLPGDERGWTEYGRGWQVPDPVRKLQAEARMTEDACLLDHEQRQVVEMQIAETCRFRGWKMHAVNCRLNHVHAVVTTDLPLKIVRNQLKAWCTRRLKELEKMRHKDAIRENWWTERGSQRFINDGDCLDAAILYVRDGQDQPHQC